MKQRKNSSRFDAEVLAPLSTSGSESWAFVLIPKKISAILSRRGRLTVDVSINGEEFRTLLEPDGKKSHWLRIENRLLKRLKILIGEVAQFEIVALDEEPKPEIPADLADGLKSSPEALLTWKRTTNIAKLDWIHWITSAKQEKTRAKRINDACEMLASGKERVCCFDTSGYYSKALSAPKAK